MFKAELEDASVLKDSIQAISNLINEGLFRIKENGIELLAADPAMVALVDFKLSSRSFSSYNFEKEEEVGLSIEKLNSILRRASARDKIVLSLEENAFSIILKNGATRKFSLPLLRIDKEEVPATDQLTFKTQVDLKTSALNNGIGDASIIGDALTIKIDQNTLTLESEGDSSKAKFVLQKGSDEILDIQGESSKSMFSLDYLTKMIKAEKLSDTVKLYMGDNFPLKMEFKVPDKVELSFILAPRIEEE